MNMGLQLSLACAKQFQRCCSALPHTPAALCKPAQSSASPARPPSPTACLRHQARS